jgi:(5-formylfuran-3-yl)methyl phosphate transaminase
MKVSARMESITSFIVMDVLETALEMERDGADIIHLEVGEPDFAPPRAVMEALARAAREGHTHYTHSLGVLELREAIAGWYKRTYGVEIDPRRIVVTPGTSGAFLNTIAVLLDPGEKLLLTDPGYPCYPNFARLLGIEPSLLPIEASDGFVPRRQAIAAALSQGAKAVLMASPANPTGALIPPDLLEYLSGLPVPFISDEIYHGLVYSGERARTAIEYSDRAIVVNGLSKRAAMTGLRIGWAIIPPELVRPFQKLNQNIFICADSISQQAAIAALTDPSCDEDIQAMVRTYDHRRRVLMDGLKSAGFKLHCEPRGAFYIFADISEYSNDGYEFAFRMLREARVAATPGVDFGRNNTGHFLRFAYTRDVSRIEEASSRIRKWLAV